MTPLETVVAALEARGHTIRNGATRCPAHDDNNPSLSVGEKADGKAVVKCHAGCTSKQIVDALNLTFADLFPKKADASAIVARYPYTDELGNVVVTVVRKFPKGFHREPAGIKNVPIYNLPNVLKAIADGLDIWVVEGEKDVHTLERHGETATCNIGGADSFTFDNAEQLAGARTVHIVADRDAAGRNHARAVLDLLIAHDPPPTVYIWEAAAGKDISDHYAAGLTINDLLVGEYDEPATPTETEEPHPWVDWQALWAEDLPDEEWVIEPLIPKGRGVSLYAPAKEGKSTILLAAAAAAATGRPVFGQTPQPPRRLVYGDYEMTRADLKARLTELGYGPDTDLTNLYYYLIPAWAPLDTVEGGVMLTAAALAHQAEAVFIDTIGRAVAGDEDKADTLRAFYRCTGQALKREGIAWLRADHSGKDPTKGARGTSAKNDDIDIQWSFKRGDGSITIKRTHTRIAWAPETITLERKEDDNGIVSYEITGERGYGPGTKDLADILDGLDVPTQATVKQAREALKNAGQGAPNVTLSDAVRYRKTSRNVPRNDIFTPSRNVPRNENGNNHLAGRNVPRNATERDPRHVRNVPHPYNGADDTAPTDKELF